jgi:(p)ppGpp synthase/HD superfamily hydrolase
VKDSEPTLSGAHVWQRAFDFAARRHQGQYRDNGVTPYATHPMRVAMILATVYEVTDERILAAAVMHDLIEDTSVDRDEIAELFDDDIAAWVAAMSKDMRMEHDAREAAYDAQLADAAWPARLIKLGDVYDNVTDAPEGKRASSIAKAHRAIALAGAEPELDLAVERLKERIAAVESAV